MILIALHSRSILNKEPAVYSFRHNSIIVLTLFTILGGNQWIEVVKAEDLKPKSILPQFETAWGNPKGYMRPLDDAGWQARMHSLMGLVRLKSKALPILENALSNGKAETRILAAQALVYLAEPKSKTLLLKTLDDPIPAVRLYAIDGLSMFGKLPADERFLKIKNSDRNRDVRSHMRFALARSLAPKPAELRDELLTYDLKKMNTAKLNQTAPDFTLTDADGKARRLGSFRGKKAIVLVFIYGDT